MTTLGTESNYCKEQPTLPKEAQRDSILELPVTGSRAAVTEPGLLSEDDVYDEDSTSIIFCIISKRFVNDRLIPRLDNAQSMPFKSSTWRFSHLAPVEVGLDAVVTDLHRDLSLGQIRSQERRLHTHSLLLLGLNHIPD